MTIKDAIQGMLDFYRAVEAVYSDLPEEIKVAYEVKMQFNSCLAGANEAVEELEKMQTTGINCDHCKYDGSGANACKECMLYRLATVEQKSPLLYEPI